MPQFRKKPVVIDAVQFTEELAKSMLIDREAGPFELTAGGHYHPARREIHSAYISIKTLEGVMQADIGDWIIKGIKGECYPCKPDIFAATYEAINGTRQMDEDTPEYEEAKVVLDAAILAFAVEADRCGVYMPSLATYLRFHADELADAYPDDTNGGNAI